MAEMRGTTRQEKGRYIPPDKRVPNRPEYKHYSKAQFIEAERKRLEKEARLKQLSVEMDKELSEPAPEAAPEAAPKKAGRPKKAE